MATGSRRKGAVDLTTRRHRSVARIAGLRGAQVLALALVVHFLVLPQLGGTRRAITLLDEVDVKLLVLGIAAELASIVTYAELIRALLPPEHRPTLMRTTRIMLSGLAVNNVVPSGGAAGGALAYRQLREVGVPSADAGFALGAQSIGSAVVLNALLWLALVAAIPLTGFNPVYATAAGAGALLLALFAGTVVALTRGEDASVRIACRIARFIPRANPDSLAKIIERVAERVKAIGTHPGALRTAIYWSTAHWLLDAASLWIFLAAFGHRVRPDELFIAYGIAFVLAAIPITPGGLGVVEVTLTAALVGFGTPSSVAGLGVASYRLVSYWLPIPLGAASYLSLRFWAHPTAARAEMQRAVDNARREAEQARRDGAVIAP
ncbi:MAG: putative heme transporter [Actinomycetota bacterium]|nr:putative heme transporter [Actinomycetota bacterium]